MFSLWNNEVLHTIKINKIMIHRGYYDKTLSFIARKTELINRLLSKGVLSNEYKNKDH